MKEKDVIECVIEHFHGEGYFVRRQFEISKGKVDVAAFKWDNDYEIDSVAVECKGEKTVMEIYDILRGQIADYQKCFPRVFIATPNPRKDDVQIVKGLCNINKAGYITVNDEGEVDIKLKAEENPKLDHKLYESEVRAQAATFLTFTDIFSELFVEGEEKYTTKGRWISTKGDVQLCASAGGEEGEDIFYEINIENLRTVENFSQMKPKEFLSVLKKCPQDSFLALYRERYIQRGVRIRIPLIQKYLKDVSYNDICYMVELAGKERGSFHLNISKKIWDAEEILSRDEHLKRMRDAKVEMQELHDFLCST